MCPLRFILIFLSMVLAAFVACKALWSTNDDGILPSTPTGKSDDEPKDGILQRGCARVSSGFWTLVDMASGRYLWRAVAASKNDSTKTKQI